MSITGIGSNYNSSIYGNTYAAKSNETSNTGTEEQTRRTAKDELSYLTEKYECLKSTDYSVNINSSLLAKAANDEKTSEWLEYNLSLIPKVVENLKSAAAARGSKVISCNITINGYDSITTEMVSKSESDSGTEKSRKELEDKIKEMREEKKAEEKRAKRRAEKKAAEEAGNETGEYTISVTGRDIKAVMQKVIAAASGTSAPTGASFDITA